jgi:hypothetical protein
MKKISFEVIDNDLNILKQVFNNNMYRRIALVSHMATSYSFNHERFVFEKLLWWTDENEGFVISATYLDIQDVIMRPMIVPVVRKFYLHYLDVKPEALLLDFDAVQSVSIYKHVFKYENIDFDVESALHFQFENNMQIMLEFSEEGGLPRITMHVSKGKIEKVLNEGLIDYSFRCKEYQLSNLIKP